MEEVLAPPTSHPNDKCATPSNAGSDTSRTLRPNASPGTDQAAVPCLHPSTTLCPSTDRMCPTARWFRLSSPNLRGKPMNNVRRERDHDGRAS